MRGRRAALQVMFRKGLLLLCALGMSVSENLLTAFLKLVLESSRVDISSESQSARGLLNVCLQGSFSDQWRPLLFISGKGIQCEKSHIDCLPESRSLFTETHPGQCCH